MKLISIILLLSFIHGMIYEHYIQSILSLVLLILPITIAEVYYKIKE